MRVSEQLTADLQAITDAARGTIGSLIYPVTNVLVSAKGDGVTDDTQAIKDSIAGAPAGGGVLYIPPGTYKVSSPITIDKPMLVLAYGATFKPSVDTDVLRITAATTQVMGLVIDGTNVASGSGIGITVGYGGANAHGVVLDNVTVTRMRGHGLVWEQGAYLTTRYLLVSYCVGDGLRFTNNYDDNNHGVINAHVISCTGIGYRVMDNAVTPNNSSRHHLFVNVKSFSCTGGGVKIETRDNHGELFLELNSGNQLELTATSKANHIVVIGVPAAFEAIVDSGFGNVVAGGNQYDEWVYYRLRAERLKLRDPSMASLVIEPASATAINVYPEDATGNVEVKWKKQGATSFRPRFEDGMYVGASGGVIYSIYTGGAALNFPSIAAGASSTLVIPVAACYYGDVVQASPDITSSNMEAGLRWHVVAGNAEVQIVMTNTSGAPIDPASRTWKAIVFKT